MYIYIIYIYIMYIYILQYSHRLIINKVRLTHRTDINNPNKTRQRKEKKRELEPASCNRSS